MKKAILFILIVSGLGIQPAKAQEALPSAVYLWDAQKAEKTSYGSAAQLLKGSTTHLSLLEIETVTVKKGKKVPEVRSEDMETLVIVKDGTIGLNTAGINEELEKGSIAVVLPGEGFSFKNDTKKSAVFYLMKYKSRSGIDAARGSSSGGPFAVHWDKVEYRETKKGGRRNIFDRPTAMCEDFEMHVTNLNPGQESHPPHTHEVEEIILMIEGNVSMHIDGSEHPATIGDLSFLDSMVPHRPKNIGKEQCSYYAFQWK